MAIPVNRLTSFGSVPFLGYQRLSWSCEPRQMAFLSLLKCYFHDNQEVPLGPLTPLNHPWPGSVKFSDLTGIISGIRIQTTMVATPECHNQSTIKKTKVCEDANFRWLQYSVLLSEKLIRVKEIWSLRGSLSRDPTQQIYSRRKFYMECRWYGLSWSYPRV